MRQSKKVVIVEDHAMYREVLCAVCARECGLAVLGATDRAATAIALVRQHRPDLLVLDIGLPDEDGFSVLAAFAPDPEIPSPRTVVISASVTEYVISNCEKYHVSGFADKGVAGFEHLALAIRAVANGNTLFSGAYEAARRTWYRDSNTVAKRLTDAEQSIFPLFGRGLSDVEIAALTGRNEATVKRHRSDILNRLELPNTPKLMEEARRRGFLSSR